MYQQDETTEKEKIHLWLAILAERRGKNINKNWIVSEPLAWPQLPDQVNGTITSS